MSAEPHDKPIRVLLQDISSSCSNTEEFNDSPRGLVSPPLVNRVVICTSLLSLLLAVVTFLAMIWESIDLFIGYRCLGSIAVVFVATIIFREINALHE